MAVLEELVAKLGFRVGSTREAQQFLKMLEGIKKGAKDANRSLQTNFSGSNGSFGKMTRDIERTTAALQKLRREASKPLRVNGFGPGFGVGPGGYLPMGRRGLGGRGAYAGGTAGREFVSGLGAGTIASRGAGAAAALMGGLAVASATRSSMRMERQMIDIAKATDATPEREQQIEKFLFDLARATGKNKEELASIYSAGGYAGRPTSELDQFTEYGAKAAVAWRTTTEETGQALAEIGNIYSANQTRIEEVGDAINAAADSSAAKESDLLEYLRRVGASGKLAGIQAESMLAFGAAMKEVGVRTDVAATGMEAFLNLLKLGEEFSKSAGEGIEALGYKSTPLRKAFVANPVQTMLGFLDKLANVKDPLKQAEIMVNAFGKEYQDDIAKLMNARKRVGELLNMLNDPSKSRGSVREQFTKQLEYDVSKIDKAEQAIDVLQARLGKYMKKILGFGAEMANDMIDGIESKTDPDKAGAEQLLRNFQIPVSPWVNPPEKPATHSPFKAKPGGPFGALGNRMRWAAGAGAPLTPPTFGSLTDRMNWSTQSTEAKATVIKNENTGNDQRTQSVSVTVNASGLEQVGAAVGEAVKKALGAMGPSVAKIGSIPTGTSVAP